MNKKIILFTLNTILCTSGILSANPQISITPDQALKTRNWQVRGWTAEPPQGNWEVQGAAGSGWESTPNSSWTLSSQTGSGLEMTRSNGERTVSIQPQSGWTASNSQKGWTASGNWSIDPNTGDTNGNWSASNPEEGWTASGYRWIDPSTDTGSRHWAFNNTSTANSASGTRWIDPTTGMTTDWSVGLQNGTDIQGSWSIAVDPSTGQLVLTKNGWLATNPTNSYMQASGTIGEGFQIRWYDADGDQVAYLNCSKGGTCTGGYTW
jgi:hypothetical protein